jgi:murein DD-endopeptidase MepM/ murein hydrolase activator NlpD
MMQAATRTRRKRAVLLHVAVYSGEGARVAAFTVPRRLLHGGVAAAITGSVAVALLLADGMSLRRSQSAAEAMIAGQAAEQAKMAALQADREAVREELTSWPVLQAAIASPFGHAVPPAELAAVNADDGDELLRAVRGATATLRRVAALMRRFDGALAHLPSHWPVRAAINSGFGPRRSPWTGDIEHHRGVDIRASEGTPVRAPAAGSITFTGDKRGYGLTVVVEHGRDIRTRYGHLSRIAVRRGDRIDRGQLLGWSGRTGRATGAHLHYEVIVAGRHVDPRAYLWD